MALTMVKAPEWVIMHKVFSKQAQFTCGDCAKVTLKAKLVKADWKDFPGVMIAVAQCQWCGAFNSFFKNGEAMVFPNVEV